MEIRFWMLLGFAIGLAPLALPALAETRADARAAQDVTRLETLYSQAFVTGDVGLADKVLADGFIGLMESRGRPYDKRDMLTMLGRHPSQASARITSLVVRLNGDTATALGAEDDRDKGSRRVIHHVWLDTWRRTPEGWRLLSSAEIALRR